MISYKDLPDNSRAWVYQSDREFTTKEVEMIKSNGNEFLRTWNSHGASLQAAFEIFYNRFLVIFVDENHASASGCSIDKSVHFIKQIENNLNASLFNRTLVAYRKEGEILFAQLAELEKTLYLSFGESWGEVTVFNNLVSTKKEFLTNWEIPLKDSWIKEKLLI